MSQQHLDKFPLDEFTFQQKLLQDPANLDAEVMQFLEKNPEKLKGVQQVKTFNLKLHSVMQVQPPEGLADRILMKNCFAESANDVHWLKPMSMVAASALLIVVATWSSNTSLWEQQGGSHSVNMDSATVADGVLKHIIEHVKEDPSLMAEHSLALNDNAVQKIFNFVGASLNKSISNMSYAGPCVINGEQGLHVVIQEADGPVTVIVLPGVHLDVMQSFNQGGFMGQMIPVEGAVVAIVGTSDIQLAMAQMDFFKSVSFS